MELIVVMIKMQCGFFECWEEKHSYHQTIEHCETQKAKLTVPNGKFVCMEMLMPQPVKESK